MNERWLLAGSMALALALAASATAGCNAIFGIEQGQIAPADGGGGGRESGGGGSESGGGGGEGGGAGSPAEMIFIEAGTFSFEAEGGSTSASIPSPFWIDTFEVTVARFQAWLDAGRPPPCEETTCPLDKNGPYTDAMIWLPQWGPHLASTAYGNPGQCSNAGDANDAAPTLGAGDGSFPIVCVNWYQAVAFCAWEGKRLPTETEWQYVASGRGEGRAYPWGFTAPVGCERAIWRDGATAPSFNGCGFPKPVGSAPKGASRDGVYDMAGGVFEWLWDAYAPYPKTATASYAGPPAGVDPEKKLTRGGSFTWEEPALRTNDRDSTDSVGIHADIGMRCAKSQ
jgi:sulfatase modifying factor 1